MAGLSDDIWAYSGLGCRNVSLLFLPRGSEPKLQVTDVNPKYKNNYLQQRALLAMQGERFVDLGLRGAGRAMGLSECVEPDRRRSLRLSGGGFGMELSAHDRELQCVVSERLCTVGAWPFGRLNPPP